MSGRGLIYFFSDYGYLTATLVVALQIVEMDPGAHGLDVHIYVQSDGVNDLGEATEFAREHGIALKPWTAASALGNRLDFADGHVSPATLGRLLVANEISDDYARIIYMDGDVQALGDIQSLFAVIPPAGSLVAAVDSKSACISSKSEPGKSLSTYMSALGISSPTKYFNAGILLAERQTWCDIAGRAIEFILENPELCKYHDQSALNAVASGMFRPMHPRFNYGPMYDEIGVPFSPALYHYHGAKKPWAASKPFGARAFAPYDALRAILPSLPVLSSGRNDGPVRPKFSPRRAVRNFLRRRRLAQYVRGTDFVLD